MPLWAGGEFAPAKEQIKDALAATSQPVKWGTGPHDHDLYVILADIAAEERDLVELREYAPIAEQLAAREQHPLYLAIAHRALAVVRRLEGEHDAAVSRLNHALEIFRKLDTRWQLGRTLSELGELEQSRQNDRLAYDYFSRALAEFEAMRAAPDALATRLRLQKILH